MTGHDLQVHDQFCPERHTDYLKDGCDYCLALQAARADEREDAARRVDRHAARIARGGGRDG